MHHKVNRILLAVVCSTVVLFRAEAQDVLPAVSITEGQKIQLNVIRRPGEPDAPCELLLTFVDKFGSYVSSATRFLEPGQTKKLRLAGTDAVAITGMQRALVRPEVSGECAELTVSMEVFDADTKETQFALGPFPALQPI